MKNIAIVTGASSGIGRQLVKRLDNLGLNEIWGKKSVPGNPNFRDGVSPHLWLNGDKLGWYAYQPTTKDFDILSESVKEYASIFKDFSMEKEQKQSIKKQLSDKKETAPKKSTKNKQNDLEV